MFNKPRSPQLPVLQQIMKIVCGCGYDDDDKTDTTALRREDNNKPLLKMLEDQTNKQGEERVTNNVIRMIGCEGEINYRRTLSCTKVGGSTGYMDVLVRNADWCELA
jgi:hypothetical protein